MGYRRAEDRIAAERPRRGRLRGGRRLFLPMHHERLPLFQELDN
jgi:hypothetical protein